MVWNRPQNNPSAVSAHYSLSAFTDFQAERKVVEANLDWAMPELSPARRRRIAKGCYQWGAEFAMDVLRMRSWQGKLKKKYIFKTWNCWKKH